jgi:acetamidase/formamidase
LRGTLPEDFPEFQARVIPMDRKAMTAKLPWGPTIPLQPFFGILATAPRPEYGRVSSVEPREYGGNVDCKEYVPGTSLFLPVFVPGALFSAGDGHAVQGDGEVCLTALETCLKGTFELVVHKKKLAMPRAITPTHYITIGLNEDLDDAAKQALRDMIAWLVEMKGWKPAEAYVFCSLACDLHVTQLVDGNKGIHAMQEEPAVMSGRAASTLLRATRVGGSTASAVGEVNSVSLTTPLTSPPSLRSGFPSYSRSRANRRGE